MIPDQLLEEAAKTSLACDRPSLRRFFTAANIASLFKEDCLKFIRSVLPNNDEHRQEFIKQAVDFTIEKIVPEMGKVYVEVIGLMFKDEELDTMSNFHEANPWVQEKLKNMAFCVSLKLQPMYQRILDGDLGSALEKRFDAIIGDPSPRIPQETT